MENLEKYLADLKELITTTPESERDKVWDEVKALQISGNTVSEYFDSFDDSGVSFDQASIEHLLPNWFMKNSNMLLAYHDFSINYFDNFFHKPAHWSYFSNALYKEWTSLNDDIFYMNFFNASLKWVTMQPEILIETRQITFGKLGDNEVSTGECTYELAA